MAAKRLTKQQVEETKKLVEKYGGNIAEASRQSGIPKEVIRYRMGRALSKESKYAEDMDTERGSWDDLVAECARLLKLNPDLSEREFLRECKLPEPRRYVQAKNAPGSWAAFKRLAMDRAAISEQALTIRERQRANDRINLLQNQVRGLHRELNRAEDLRHAVFGLAAVEPEPPRWSVTDPKGSTGPGLPMLFFSDAQWGEKIAAAELDGVNEYNVEVAARRYRALIEKTIDLAMNHMVNPKYPGIIYVRGGDMVSGEIHQELAKTNELLAIPAVKSLVEHEIWGISQLVEKFKRVYVVSVPGNHGRTTMKYESKNAVDTNYDTLSAWMLENWFSARGDGRVKFRTSTSPDVFLPIYGYNFLVTHGDRIGSRGGHGFIGPAATIARGMKKLIEYYAKLGKMVDYVLCGHFHTLLELEFGFANGSMPGISEFARDGRMTPAPPQQWLLFIHPKYGVTCRWPVMLEQRPKLNVAAPDVFWKE